MAGGSFVGGTGAITLNAGSFAMTGGAFTSTSGTLTIAGSGSFSITGGTFNANNGTLQFIESGSGWQPGNASYNDVIINKEWGNVYLVGSASIVDLSLIKGGFTGGTAFVSGNLTISPSWSTGNTTVIELTGSNAQTITATPGAYITTLSINKSNGSTATLSGSLVFQNTNLSVLAGTFATTGGANTGVIIFSGSTQKSWIPLSETYQLVRLNGTNTISLSSRSANIVDLDLFGGQLVSGTAFVSGNITVSPSFGRSSLLALELTGSSAQTITAISPSVYMPELSINKSSGSTATLSGSAVFSSTKLSVLAGTFATTGGANTGVITFTANSTSWSPLSETYQLVRVNKANNAALSLSSRSVNIVDLDLLEGILSSGTAFVSGNLTISSSFDKGTAALVLNGTGAQTINAAGPPTQGQFTIDKSAGTATLATSLSFGTAGQDLSLTSGTLSLGGFSLTVPDTITVGSFGVLQLQGNEQVSRTTLTLQPTSTVTFTGSTTGSGTFTLNNLSHSYSNLTLDSGLGSDVFLMSNSLDINNNLNIKSGILNTSTSNYKVTLAGSWLNSGTFTANSSNVTLDGSNQAISGNTTFFILSKSVTTADTLTFAAGASQVISGTMSLAGASGQLLSLRSSASGTYWFVNPTGTRSISYLNVKDSYNYGTTIDARGTNSTDSGHNYGWFFAAVAGALFFGTHF